MSQSREGLERRRAPRHAVEHAAPLPATAGGRVYSCGIEDISVSGIRLRFRGEAPEGRVIALEHPMAGTLCGACVWREGRHLGVEFQSPHGEVERVLRCVCLVL
jgi:hypothetical protein